MNPGREAGEPAERDPHHSLWHPPLRHLAQIIRYEYLDVEHAQVV